jgi:hypothetical protein
MMAGVLEQRIEILALQEAENLETLWEDVPDCSFTMISPSDKNGIGFLVANTGRGFTFAACCPGVRFVGHGQ